MRKDSIINKLALLINEVGLINDFNLIKIDDYSNPSIFSFDRMQCHKKAKEIANHIGLHNVTIIISVGNEKRNTAGSIELDNSNEVFITLNENIIRNSKQILCVLAHELCHKYLQIKGIKLEPTLENELLTDITTAYLGLGELSIIGCETYSKTIEETKIEKIGYLTKDEFIFTQTLVTDIYGLQSEHNRLILESNYNSVYLKYQNKEKQLDDLKINLSNLNNDIVIMKNFILFELEDSVSNIHREINQISNDLKLVNKFKNRNIIFNKYYILNIEKRIEKKIHLLNKMVEKIRGVKKDVKKTTSLNHKNHKMIFESLFNFKCPICHKKMRITKNVKAKVNCNVCNYEFYQDSRYYKGSNPYLNFVKIKLYIKKIIGL